MRSIIRQSVDLPAPADQLFDMYLDPSAHSAITGHAMTIGRQEGAEFRAFGGQLSGQILAVVRPRLIVQSWRSTKFFAEDADSTLILSFSSAHATANEVRIELVHLDVPDHDYEDVIAGWQKYYWAPWLAYLQQQAQQ